MINDSGFRLSQMATDEDIRFEVGQALIRDGVKGTVKSTQVVKSCTCGAHSLPDYQRSFVQWENGNTTEAASWYFRSMVA